MKKFIATFAAASAVAAGLVLAPGFASPASAARCTEPSVKSHLTKAKSFMKALNDKDWTALEALIAPNAKRNLLVDVVPAADGAADDVTAWKTAIGNAQDVSLNTTRVVVGRAYSNSGKNLGTAVSIDGLLNYTRPDGTVVKNQNINLDLSFKCGLVTDQQLLIVPLAS